MVSNLDFYTTNRFLTYKKHNIEERRKSVAISIENEVKESTEVKLPLICFVVVKYNRTRLIQMWRHS